MLTDWAEMCAVNVYVSGNVSGNVYFMCNFCGGTVVVVDSVRDFPTS